MVTIWKRPDTWQPSPPGGGDAGAAGVRPPRGPQAYPPSRPPPTHNPFITSGVPIVPMSTFTPSPSTWTSWLRPVDTHWNTPAPVGQAGGGGPASSLFAAATYPPSAVSDDVHEARIQAENARGATADASMLQPQLGSAGVHQGVSASSIPVPWSAAAPAIAAAASSGFPSRFWTQRRPHKYALLIGMNYQYTPEVPTLRGCIFDVRNMRRLLTTRCGFDPAHVVTLTDEPVDGPGGIPGCPPTRDVILSGMAALVAKAAPGDSLFFHFSGHGGQVSDINGDEPDGKDEVLMTVDARHVVDDEVHQRLVNQLPPGVRMTALIDACHSASALDLPHLLGAPWHGGRGCSKGCGTVAGCGGDRVVAFGACRDEQYAADWHGAKGGTASAGAATTFFIEAIENNVGGITNRAVLEYMQRRIVEHNLPQVPALSSSCPLDPNAPLVL